MLFGQRLVCLDHLDKCTNRAAPLTATKRTVNFVENYAIWLLVAKHGLHLHCVDDALRKLILAAIVRRIDLHRVVPSMTRNNMR